MVSKVENVGGVERVQGVELSKLCGDSRLREFGKNTMCAEKPYDTCGPNNCEESEIKKGETKRVLFFF